jgi:predicted glycosyltransferase
MNITNMKQSAMLLEDIEDFLEETSPQEMWDYAKLLEDFYSQVWVP